MPKVHKHWSYSFTIGLALFLVCLFYIPQWQHYAPNAHQAAPALPYLTPWTVLSVTTLGLALALIAAPVRTHYPILVVLSKTLSTVVFCFAAVFLLEYASGIRVPDLDIFFLPDSSGQRFSLYSARPTPHSATTSLLFASALLLFHRQTGWRKKAFRICVLAALILPILAAISYVGEFFSPPAQPPAPKAGLSLPAVILYLTLGSGILRLSFSSSAAKSAVAQVHKIFRRPV